MFQNQSPFVSKLRVPYTLLFATIVGSGALVSCEEAFDNIDSRIQCSDYCNKKFDCAGENPTNDQTRSCVRECRDDMENDCGNEHQAAANDALADCNDMGCGSFQACMIFEVAPECFGFASN